MKQKIEWYREVLELEPGSKIFFPLAQMLAKDGQTDDAITVLRQGIARHADHMEARFLLVELLFHKGGKQELWNEVDTVSAMLDGYPGFWQAWSERLGASETTRDAGLAVAFLAASMRAKSLSWADIIASGLKGLLSDEFSQTVTAETPLTASVTASDATCAPKIVQNGTVVKHAASVAVPENEAPSAELPASPQNKISVVSVVAPAKSAVPAVAVNTPPTPAPVEEYNTDDDEEEPFSLRTRSMAEVLAEQGDTAGALEIYQELLDTAASNAEKTALSSRMAELKQCLESGFPAQDKIVEEVKTVPAKSRLSEMLEALAQRLEARSLQ